jgi:hypothetical protein
MAILDPQFVTPRCRATVELISRVQRPYLFLVTVVGLHPHAYTRKYNVVADSDDSAAFKGIEVFVKEFSAPGPLQEVSSVAPKATLQ